MLSLIGLVIWKKRRGAAMADDVSAKAIGELVLRELVAIRRDLAGIRAAQADLAKALLHLKRDGVIKNLVARVDQQVRKIEQEAER
jgi:hypothetical protein